MELTVEGIKSLITALAPATTTQVSPPVVSTGANNVTSLCTAENSISEAPTTSIYARGLGSTSQTGIKKSNANVAHACSSNEYVNKIIYQAGAFGGKIIQTIRDGIKAILAYFGVNPSSSALSSKLKHLALYIKDKIKFIKDITDAINGYVVYINAIKQLITYVLSLPAQLLTFFKECITELTKQLIAGYNSALDGVDPTAPDDTLKSLKEVQTQVTQLNQSVTALVATSTGAVASLTNLNQTPTGNSEAQAAATKEVFAAAGFAQSPIEKA